MSGRNLVIGDIHGALKALEQVLDRAKVTAMDRIIMLGDYVDGWSESPQVLNRLIELQSSHNCIFIRGNHDSLCEQWLAGAKTNNIWLSQGGQATVDAYREISEQIRQLHLGFLKSLDNYFIDEHNRLFVHAGFTNLHGVKFEYFPEMYYWDRSLWEMVLAMDSDICKGDDLFPPRLTHYKEIFIGHTPTLRIGKTEPVKAISVWNLDTGAAYTGPLTIMDVDTHEFWQSDPVNELYPMERGRN